MSTPFSGSGENVAEQNQAAQHLGSGSTASVDATRAASVEPAGPSKELKKRTNVALFKYGGARMLLFLALTVVIQTLAVLVEAPVPLTVSALLALIVAFPLSMFVFKKQRLEATQSVAELSRRRREHKEWLRSELESR